MPQGGSLRTSTIDSSTTDVIGNTLIFSSDVIKTEVFNPEDHVILVVPDQADHLVASDPAHEDASSYEITSTETADVGSSSPNRLRETIKSNFLVIAKLLPSKSPPPLVPIASKECLTSEDSLRLPSCGSELPEQSAPLLKPTPSRSRRQNKTRQSGIRGNTYKQEVPEIFSKMFPASYNEVLLKQISDIIFFKYGKETLEETDIPTGIRCPHCRKSPSTLSQLKDHLHNCHTYCVGKRKNGGSGPASKQVLKKMLYRCGTCDEAFITEALRVAHGCTELTKSVVAPSYLKDDERPPFQASGAPSEVVNSPAASPPPPSANPPSGHLPEPSIAQVICPICDVELEADSLDQHVDSHYSSVVGDETTTDGTVHIAICVNCEGEFKIRPGDKDSAKCSKCR